MKRRPLLLLVVAVVFSGWSVAGAAVEKWMVDVGVEGDHSGFANELQVHDTWDGFGGRVGLVLRPALQVEAIYDSISTEKKGLPGSSYEQDHMSLRVMSVFKAAEEVSVNPYMFAGAGLVVTKFDTGVAGAKEQKDGTEFEDVGFGARWNLWKGLHANAELFMRHLHTLKETNTHTYFAYGVSWLFGGKKK